MTRCVNVQARELPNKDCIQCGKTIVPGRYSNEVRVNTGTSSEIKFSLVSLYTKDDDVCFECISSSLEESLTKTFSSPKQ